MQANDQLADVLESELGIAVNVNSIFACQIKRLHEYKRQTITIFSMIHRYLKIKRATPEERKNMQPWTMIFAGKAAPGYYIAKLVIRLIVNVGKTVNNDPDVGDLLRICFIPDYSVSIAEVLVPAADLSVQVSTAGTEASGTVSSTSLRQGEANLTEQHEVGPQRRSSFGYCRRCKRVRLSRENPSELMVSEIAEDAGEDQCFMFGHLNDDVAQVRFNNSYNPLPLEQRSPEVSANICWCA